MLFDARQFFEVGVKLIEDAAREEGLRVARLRTAYGRLYYGLFLLVRAALVRRFGLPDHRLSHGRISSDLQNSSLPQDVRSIGRELERLYALRRVSDYVLNPDEKWSGTLQDIGKARTSVDRVVKLARTVEQVDFTSAARILSSR